jgi:hypothetical protein
MQHEITELRNQVRTLKRIVYGFGCLLVAGIVVSATSMQTVPDVIQAKSFGVVNDEGKVVAAIGASKDGGALGIFDNDGKPVAGLGADKDGGVLTINNKDGKPVAGLFADENGGGWLSIHNKDGKLVAGLIASEDGGGLRILNNKGEVTSSLP